MNPELDPHELTRISLGPYVLGQLSITERSRVDLHLAGCTACRHELAELGPVAVALEEIKVAGQAFPSMAPSAQLQRSVFAEIARARPARRFRGFVAASALGMGVAASAVAGLDLAGVISIEQGSTAQTMTVAGEKVDVVPRSLGIRADAELINHTWGVEVVLTGDGFKAGQRYQLFVLDARGRRFAAGEFVGTGQREMVCRLNSGLLREQARGFLVREGRGRTVVTAEFAASRRT